MEQIKKSGRGCLFYSGLFGGILLFVIALVGFLGWHYINGLANQFTDKNPMPLPEVKLVAEDASRLQSRIETFRQAIEEDKLTRPLILTADEVNSCIATDPYLQALKGHVYITIDGSRINTQLSIPAEELGLDMLRGRYVNATGEFSISLTNGLLRVVMKSLSAKNKPLPRSIMGRIQGYNLAESWNSDPQSKATFSRLESVQVEDGKIIFLPKKSGGD